VVALLVVDEQVALVINLQSSSPFHLFNFWLGIWDSAEGLG